MHQIPKLVEMAFLSYVGDHLPPLFSLLFSLFLVSFVQSELYSKR